MKGIVMDDDEKIDILLKNSSVKTSDAFTAETLAIISEESKRDTFIDEKLARMEKFALPEFADKVMAAIRRGRIMREKIFAAGGLAAAMVACATIAVLTMLPMQRLEAKSVSADDYESMSKIADEISAISTLLVQEEIRDAIVF